MLLMISILREFEMEILYFYLASNFGVSSSLFKSRSSALAMTFLLPSHQARATYRHSFEGTNQAHFPNSAISAAPKNRQTSINVKRLLSLVRSGLNIKSLANNSTNPV
jgi:hypothetical protein